MHKAREAAQDRGLAAAGWAEERGHPLRRRGKAGVERELAERSPKFRADRRALSHAPARAKRFSIRIIARMTANANATIPPASRLASRQRIVSTKSKIAVDMTRVRPGMLPPIIRITPNSPTVRAKASVRAPHSEATQPPGPSGPSAIRR